MFVFLKTSVNNKINHSLNEQESSCLKRNYSISFDFNGEFSDMPESKSPNIFRREKDKAVKFGYTFIMESSLRV